MDNSSDSGAVDGRRRGIPRERFAAASGSEELCTRNRVST
jgi:hypothetical protein